MENNARSFLKGRFNLEERCGGLVFGIVWVTMFSWNGSGARSTLEEMLDLMRTVETEEKKMSGGETLEELPPLPLRPTSRARLPSSVRAKKALGASLDNLALPKSGSGVLKENIALGSPVANLVVATGPATVGAESAVCLARAFDELPVPVALGDLASDNGHTPFAKRENADSTESFASPHLLFSPSVIPNVSSLTEGGIAQLHSRGTLSFDDRIKSSSAHGFGHEQPSFTFLTAQEGAAPPTPQTPAPPTPVPQDPALPVTTPSSTSKKWKDDGTLRLKKVYSCAENLF